MNSPKIIAECAAEKRRQNSTYQPSLAELKAVDAVLIAQARERQTGGFDFGTSPHGLSAGLPLLVQETREGLSFSPPAKPVLISLEPSTSASPASPKGLPSAKPVLMFSFTEAQRSALSFAAQCEAEDLQCGYEAHLPEVQEAIWHLWEARRILEGGLA